MNLKRRIASAAAVVGLAIGLAFTGASAAQAYPGYSSSKTCTDLSASIVWETPNATNHNVVRPRLIQWNLLSHPNLYFNYVDSEWEAPGYDQVVVWTRGHGGGYSSPTYDWNTYYPNNTLTARTSSRMVFHIDTSSQVNGGTTYWPRETCTVYP